MLQHNNDISYEYNNYKMNEHYGFGVSYEKNDYTVKLNGGYFHNLSESVVEDNLYYLLLSGKYESDKYQILAEIGSQKSKSDFTGKMLIPSTREASAEFFSGTKTFLKLVSVAKARITSATS